MEARSSQSLGPNCSALTRQNLMEHDREQIHSQEMAIIKRETQKSKVHHQVLKETIKRLEDNAEFYKQQNKTLQHTLVSGSETIAGYEKKAWRLTQDVEIFQRKSETWKSLYVEAKNELKRIQTGIEINLQGIRKANKEWEELWEKIEKDRSGYGQFLRKSGIELPYNSDDDLEENIEDMGEKLACLTMDEFNNGASTSHSSGNNFCTNYQTLQSPMVLGTTEPNNPLPGQDAME